MKWIALPTAALCLVLGSRVLGSRFSVQNPEPRTQNQEPAGDAALGEALFFGRAECATCHEVNGRGGVSGPDLSDAARLSAAVVRQKIVDPNSAPSAAGGRGGRGGPAAPVTVVAKTKDGRE